MKVGLIDIDGHSGYPNLVLMKISAHYKAQGHHVELATPESIKDFDCGFASKVFSFTPMPVLSDWVVVGGSGVHLKTMLANKIEHICPDYDLYSLNYSLGFLTRGCIRKCEWCIVPEKEGQIQAHADITEFTRHRDVVLMDNNVLASEHGIRQLEKIAELGLRVDFNQGLDARLIDDTTARLLAKIKWLKPIRLACDNQAMMPAVQKAVGLLRWHNAVPRRYSVYVMVKDVEEALERVRFLKTLNVSPFAQPYRDFNNPCGPTPQQKAFAEWVNQKVRYNAVPWEDYIKTRKEFNNHAELHSEMSLPHSFAERQAGRGDYP